MVAQGSTTNSLTSADFPFGTPSFSIPALKRAGTYWVVLTATDLAGNFRRITGTLGALGPEERLDP